jgi:hypothetical protein
MIKHWFRPTPLQMATKELREAQITLLQAQAQADYYKGLSNTMKASIKRLERYVNGGVQ